MKTRRACPGFCRWIKTSRDEHGCLFCFREVHSRMNSFSQHRDINKVEVLPTSEAFLTFCILKNVSRLCDKKPCSTYSHAQPIMATLKVKMRLTPMLGSAKRLSGDHGPVLVYLASPLQSASAVIGVGTGKSLRSRVVGPSGLSLCRWLRR